MYPSPVDAPGDLHIPCTLDQSYYLFLENSSARDQSQVVVKYAEYREKKSMSEEEKPKKLLMVNQLWLWKIAGGK